MPDQIKRQKSYPACGRLVVLESAQNLNLLTALRDTENYSQFVAINFPSMPEAIELARRANYNVVTPPGFPDGIHTYNGTSVLKIPFSFKLSALDSEYCPQGAKTLLQVAADLESLVLPFGPDKITATYGTAASNGTAKAGETASVASSAATTSTSYVPPDNNKIFPPATCYLELIRTEDNSVGIACVGYIEDVRIRLMAPFLKGPGTSQNLPLMGEFEFTFVHHPGHTNRSYLTGGNISEQQASANTVRKRLFNTVDLLSRSDDFIGFSNSQSQPTSSDSGASP